MINGNASGSTRLFVTNVGGLGALTTNGIEVVAISGVSTSTAFTLGQPVEAGAYSYTLVEGSGGAGDGIVRNLVCGAIVTPMEGAYGNQERHPGRFAGGA